MISFVITCYHLLYFTIILLHSDVLFGAGALLNPRMTPSNYSIIKGQAVAKE